MMMLLRSSLPITISEASLAASDPLPIATPVFAIFIAGESFTPSPVTVTTNPIFCNDYTIYNFCAGLTLVNNILGFSIIL